MANYAEVRAAIAWTWVPLICGFVLFAPFEYWVSQKIFAQWAKFPQHVELLRTRKERSIYGLYFLTNSLVEVWWLVIRAKCLGEVNRSSAWLGLGTELLGPNCDRSRLHDFGGRSLGDMRTDILRCNWDRPRLVLTVLPVSHTLRVVAGRRGGDPPRTPPVSQPGQWVTPDPGQFAPATTLPR